MTTVSEFCVYCDEPFEESKVNENDDIQSVIKTHLGDKNVCTSCNEYHYGTPYSRKEIENKLNSMQEKYLKLVRFARDDGTNTSRVEESRKIALLFPNETDKLKYGDDSDWHHGFNSGVLAVLRLIHELLDGSKPRADQSMDDFPELYS